MVGWGAWKQAAGGADHRDGELPASAPLICPLKESYVPALVKAGPPGPGN